MLKVVAVAVVMRSEEAEVLPLSSKLRQWLSVK